MRRLAIGCLTGAALVLGGCNAGPIFGPSSAQPPDLTPVSSIVNALKCELADTFKEGNYLKNLVKVENGHAVVKGKLELGNVVTNTLSGEAGLEVAPAGITIGPTGSYGRSTESGQTVELEFSYDVAGGNAPDFCKNPALAAPDNVPVLVKGHPFAALLTAIQKQHSYFKAGEPRVQLGTMSYASSFTIEREVVGGVSLKFLVFSLGVTRGRARAEGQTLTMEFDLSDAPATVQIL